MHNRTDQYKETELIAMRVNGFIQVLLLFAAVNFAQARTDYPVTFNSKNPARQLTLIGQFYNHTVKPEETLLDIARRYNLGISELTAFYPEEDPWLLEAGTRMRIPGLWIVPQSKHRSIVINIPEMRLYFFHPKKSTVSTHPITVGEADTPTPIGTFRIIEREVDPEWNIPSKLQYKYNKKIIQAGDDNPLGKYWLGLSRRGYGIHGTNNAWSVGRVLSNGCIRLYPEDIEKIFPSVRVGTVVEIIYEPVKFGFRHRLIYVEIHEDPYGLIQDIEVHARNQAGKMNIEKWVNWEKIYAAMKEKSGVPILVGIVPE
ncbi:MAG: putative L,D-transpeptidase ErfK/SrfK precursor [Syntrophus sp. PtaB.Bin001]|nr:MAG: putative L,D-transpeptidase ErfK/SrfK precursor [Syntrophus sp. PtaB.Bin001]